MDALIAKGNAIRLAKQHRSVPQKSGPSNHAASKSKNNSSQADPTAASITGSTTLPRSLQPKSPAPESTRKHAHIANPKLRLHLDRQSERNARSKALMEDAELLTGAMGAESGVIEVEGELEKTWRVRQTEIAEAAGKEVSKGRQEWVLDGGPYMSRFTRNGRHIVIAGRKGHVASFDWQTGTVHAELQLKEVCRDITFLHDQSNFAVAQQKYVFIYDKNGVELHKLKSHVEPTRLEFLPYHWLLVSVGLTGYLKYQDTSTGQVLVEHRTKFGACEAMCQNLHNAVIYLGHQNGTVTLWTPNMPDPVVRQLSHLGGVTSVSVDPSSGGRYMATSGVDGKIKVWDCRNWKGTVREWTARGGGAVVEWSAKGALGVATGGSVNIYIPPAIRSPHNSQAPPPLYLTHPIPHRPLTSLRFCPFQDVLNIGHAAGLSSILVPGTGEPNFDSTEADPFENKSARQEREVRRLLDKIQPDMISLDPEFIGSLAPQSKLGYTANNEQEQPFARLPRLDRLRLQGKADDSEVVDGQSEDDGDGAANEGAHKSKAAKEKMKMRGRGKSLKRYLRKKRKNVIDPAAVAARAKLQKDREERKQAQLAKAGKSSAQKPSALDRFKRTTS